MASLSLAGRDLTGADLEGADVRHVDFSGAILNHASLASARAEKTHFDFAQLQGASLDYAQLQGASLNDAQLQGAVLDLAKLQGAWLAGAQLQGALLYGVKLQGASLDRAGLQASLLDFAQLQGATLVGAELQGASLFGAELQGAVLDLAKLQGATFVKVCVWRTEARQAGWKDIRVITPTAGARESSPGKDDRCKWTAASFEEVKRIVAEPTPTYNSTLIITLHDNPNLGEPFGIRMGQLGKERIEEALDPNKALEGADEMAKVWAAQASSSPSQEVYEKTLAEKWRETGCAADGAPYVARAILARLVSYGIYIMSPWGLAFSISSHWPYASDSPEVPKLAAAFLEKDCGARGLSEAEIAKLKAIRDRTPQPAPKP